MDRSGVRLVTALVMSASLGAATTAQAAGSCPSAQEQDARAVRDFQTMLMVSALQCSRSSPQTLASYNSFVTKARPILASAGETLRKGLVRLHGNQQGQRAYDRQVTAVANEQSAIQRSADWCMQAATLAQEATQLDPAALVTFARQSLGNSTPSTCTSN